MAVQKGHQYQTSHQGGWVVWGRGGVELGEEVRGVDSRLGQGWCSYSSLHVIIIIVSSFQKYLTLERLSCLPWCYKNFSYFFIIIVIIILVITVGQDLHRPPNSWA